MTIPGDDGQALELRLGDQHAVEGIAVMPWQRTGRKTVLDGDRERSKSRYLESAAEVAGNGDLSLLELDRRLPGTDCTDENLVIRILDGSSRGGAESSGLTERPDHRVRVEEKPQNSSSSAPSKSAMSSSSVSSKSSAIQTFPSQQPSLRGSP